MKDEALRRELKELGGKYERLDDYDTRMRVRMCSVEGRLGNLSIKDCPKCKHPVQAQVVLLTAEANSYCYQANQCLTCGTKFKCSEELVCKIIS